MPPCGTPFLILFMFERSALNPHTAFYFLSNSQLICRLSHQYHSVYICVIILDGLNVSNALKNLNISLRGFASIHFKIYVICKMKCSILCRKEFT